MDAYFHAPNIENIIYLLKFEDPSEKSRIVIFIFSRNLTFW
jgi:hypothetical protein